jgi:dTDP-D-glucose 4,6-dehydratase
VIRAFDVILHHGSSGEVYNIGSAFEISAFEIAKILLQKYGLESREKEFIQYVEARPFSDRRWVEYMQVEC